MRDLDRFTDDGDGLESAHGCANGMVRSAVIWAAVLVVIAIVMYGRASGPPPCDPKSAIPWLQCGAPR